MPFFTKESLERLRQSIDLVEVISAHVELKRAGASYKACCPFHDEKTPSFTVNRGDTHYHCYGCGAHGDAIQFLMEYLRMDFQEAVEYLANRFNVYLEREASNYEQKGPSKDSLKQALEESMHFYHEHLINSKEALKYLANRGIDREFIDKFKIGLSPNSPNALQKKLKKTGEEILLLAGLIRKNDSGVTYDFFSDRIMFPIRDPRGFVIGFSGRKYKEETFGGKYINTPETPLFKKSQVLFGLSYSRRRIAKDRQILIVEGQIDTLRLIHCGFDFAVASQGTAFGDGHVKKLVQLGVNTAYVAFDSDIAGLEASRKIGHLLQKAGIGVYVIWFPKDEDPDSFIQKKGSKAFEECLSGADDYLTFLTKSAENMLRTPAGKHEFVTNVARQIRSWGHPVMVHESLRKLAFLLRIPETSIGVGALNSVYIKRNDNVNREKIDPNLNLEGDFLRWLILMGENKAEFVQIAKANLSSSVLKVEIYKNIFEKYIKADEAGDPKDLLHFMSSLQPGESQAVEELLKKKVNRDRAGPQFIETIKKILERSWLEEREKINLQIQSGSNSEDELLELVKRFDELKSDIPSVST